MEYISHEKYSKILKNFGKTSSRKILKEGLTGGSMDAKVLSHVKGHTYKIQSPTGKVSDVYFEYHLEEAVDPPYGYSGWVSGDDGEYEYQMSAEFVSMGGGDYDCDPDYNDLDWNKIDGVAKEGNAFTGQLHDKGKIPENQEQESIEAGQRAKILNALQDNYGISQACEEFLHWSPEEAEDADGTNWDDVVDAILANPEYRKEFLDEYQFDQMYPEDPGPFESIYEPSGQITGPTQGVREDAAYNFSTLAPSERDQLKEYINSIKTIKEEISKLVAKAKGSSNTIMEAPKPEAKPAVAHSIPAKKHAEKHPADNGKAKYHEPTQKKKMGGDRTGMVLNLNKTMYEVMGEPDENPQHEGLEQHLGKKLHNAFGKVSEMAISKLKADGLSDHDIKMFLDQEIDEMLKGEIETQYDPY